MYWKRNVPAILYFVFHSDSLPTELLPLRSRGAQGVAIESVSQSALSSSFKFDSNPCSGPTPVLRL